MRGAVRAYKLLEKSYRGYRCERRQSACRVRNPLGRQGKRTDPLTSAETHPGTRDVISSALTEAEAAHALVAGQRREEPWERMQVLRTLSSAKEINGVCLLLSCNDTVPGGRTRHSDHLCCSVRWIPFHRFLHRHRVPWHHQSHANCA